MTSQPIIARSGEGLAADGVAFSVREWAHGPNAGPPLHVHHSDDEAWHVLEGRLRFRFADRTVDVDAGTTVFAAAGVAHTYGNPGPGAVRYLIISTARTFGLIDALHVLEDPTPEQTAAEYRAYDSEVLE